MGPQDKFNNETFENISRQHWPQDTLSHLPPEAQDYLDVLLRGIGHRLRNLFQSISFMLAAQAERQESAEAKESLLQAVSRLSAVAQVANLVLSRPSVENTNLRELIPLLLSAIAPERMQDFSYRIDDISLAPRRTAGFALIVNELVTNALRHGTPPIHLVVESKNGDCILQVVDAGPVKAGQNWLGQGSGFGLKIASEMLEKGLHGQLEIKHEAARTAATVKFALLEGEVDKKLDDHVGTEDSNC